MARRFRDEPQIFQRAPGVPHHRVVVHTRDAKEIRRFSFQAPSSSDLFPNANRTNEVGIEGAFAIYRFMGTLATQDARTTSDAHWTTIDYVEITATSGDGRDLVYSTSDIFLDRGPYHQVRFDMTCHPATSQDVPTLMIMEESETRL